jgi:hypothetical protein
MRHSLTLPASPGHALTLPVWRPRTRLQSCRWGCSRAKRSAVLGALPRARGDSCCLGRISHGFPARSVRVPNPSLGPEGDDEYSRVSEQDRHGRRQRPRAAKSEDAHRPGSRSKKHQRLAGGSGGRAAEGFSCLRLMHGALKTEAACSVEVWRCGGRGGFSLVFQVTVRSDSAIVHVSIGIFKRLILGCR